MQRRTAVAAMSLVGAGLLVLPATPAGAVQVPHTKVVGPLAVNWTPHVSDGVVKEFAQVGNKIIVGGSFSSVTQTRTSAALTRSNIFVYDATSGAIDTGFAPSLDGEVTALIPSADGRSVYVGGKFNNLNGVAARKLTLLSVTDGSPAPGFKPVVDGVVNDVKLVGTRLFVGGQFTRVGGVPHSGIGAVNAATGAVDPYVNVQMATRHNSGQASTAVGAFKLDVNPAGNRLVAVGNFKQVDGLDRDQAVMVDLSGPAAQVNGWQTDRYKPACFDWAFDSYIRDVDFSPDGSYFVTVATGGGVGGTLCDAAARWETAAVTPAQEPTWVDYTGGDSLWSVAVTGTAVYVGGHQRWMNNPNASDYAGPGAVPRPGLAALDPLNGLPLSWNPGRNPRGAGAYALLSTPTGLLVGSDTTYTGNFQYYHGRIAFFPLNTGAAVASTATATLPGQVVQAGRLRSTATSNIVYRVDAGGPALQAVDAGPDWAADTGDAPSPFHTAGPAAQWSPGASVDPGVAASTPAGVFDSERWGPQTWAIPAPNGAPLEVRLYFANRYGGTSQPGQRVFNVTLEGATVLSNFDIVAAAGADQRGIVRSFPITSDGTVDIDLSQVVENPLINGIEIIRTDVTPGPSNVDDVQTRAFDGASAAPASKVASADSWSNARGAVLINGILYYGWADGTFHKRSYNGTVFGTDTVIDPYNDAAWSTVNTGSNQTYRGLAPGFYSQIPNVTGLFYSGGRLYYTLFGSSAMYYRYFTPDSAIVGGQEFQVADGMDWSGVAGTFLSGNTLYFANRSDGTLRGVTFSGGRASGASQLVTGAGITGQDWTTRALFLK